MKIHSFIPDLGSYITQLENKLNRSERINKIFYFSLAISLFLILEIASVGFKPLGQTETQFMMP
tara:strand:- start:9 stop:200 length:192 start_codon:yes stop_codon:yes gene_type:complete